MTQVDRLYAEERQEAVEKAVRETTIEVTKEVTEKVTKEIREKTAKETKRKLAKARKKAAKDVTERIAVNMLKDGDDIDKVADNTGLPKTRIKILLDMINM